MAVIGIDLGGTKLSGAVFQENGTLLFKEEQSIVNHAGDEACSLVCNLALLLLKEAGKKQVSVSSIGCCVPGIAYQATGRVWAPNIAGWEDYPLLDRLREAVPDKEIAVEIDNDRACSILGEVWLGSARGCRDAIFLAVGTGIGAGIIVDGKILRGASDIAGAIGWMALDRPFQDKYAATGCLESNVSGPGLIRVARELLGSGEVDSAPLKNALASGITTKDIFLAMNNGDPVGNAVRERTIQFWGMAVANLVSLFNPEIIIFGGGIFGPAAVYLEEIRKEAVKWAQPISMRQVKLGISALGGDAGLYGAARLARNKIPNR